MNCRQTEWTDIGHDVQVQLRYVNDVLHGVAYRHKRPDNGAQCEGFAATKPAWSDGWTVLSEAPIHIEPSLLCNACGHHGFIRDGRWVQA